MSVLIYNDMDRYYPVFPAWAAIGGYLPNPEMARYVPPMEWWLVLEQLFNREYYYAWINNECGKSKDEEYEDYLMMWLACLELATEYIALPTIYDESTFDWPSKETFWAKAKKWFAGLFRRNDVNA